MNNNYKEAILPPATIGIVGGGQLGQMIALSAKAMGYKVAVLDPDNNCSTGQVADVQITADYADDNAIELLAQASDVLTYEFENVDVDALENAKDEAALPQGTRLLEITGNRINEKNFLNEINVSTTNFAVVKTESDLNQAIDQIGYPSILKTADGGYDGHGQVDLNSPSDLNAGLELVKTEPCVLEERQAFVKELSVMVTRSASGKIQSFPLAENIHYHHILHKTIVPARVDEKVHASAEMIARKIAENLKLRGVLGIEFFMLPGGKLLVNELAPRPHNSGHYSIEASNISQFEAHIRSICGLEIPTIKQIAPCVMVNLLGQHLDKARQRLPQRPDWHFHDYGKEEVRENRKMGHITILGEREEILKEIKAENIWEAEA